MKIVIGQKNAELMHLLKHAWLSLYPETEITACDTWDCTVLDLLKTQSVQFVFLDLALCDLHGIERIEELLGVLPKTHLIVTADHLPARVLRKLYAGGLSGFIQHKEMYDGLREILALIAVRGLYVSPALLQADENLSLARCELLSRRQKQVLGYLKDGLSNKQIAAKIGITEPTVKLHIHGLFHKLRATNRTQIIIKAQQLGIL
ncbi:MAG: response regulator transcription factor [Alphaproteobacteria bacterium]|nr:response regulator transcription factor [Alphaproteobacteria bacterium]